MTRDSFSQVLLIVAASAVVLWGAPPILHYVHDENDSTFLAQGALVLMGKSPGADFLFPLGFLPSFPSALAQWALGGPLGVTALGTAGFGLCFWLIAATARRHQVPLALVAAVLTVAVICIPYERFFRWQQWLMPLLSIALADRLLLSEKRTWLGLFLFGAFHAFHLTYRVDQGAPVLAAASAAVAWGLWREGRGRPSWWLAGAFATGMAAMLTMWAIYLMAVGGSVAVNIKIAWDIVVDTAASGRYGQGDPLVKLAFAAMAATYAALIGWGVAELRRGDEDRGGVMALTGLTGLSIMPSLLYYPNIFHVAFGLGPWLLGLCLLCSRPCGWLRPSLAAAAAASLLALTWPMGAASIRAGGLVAKLRDLNDVQGAPSRHRLGPLIMATRQAAPEGSEVVLVPKSADCNLTYFIQRPLATYDFVLDPKLIGQGTLFKLNLERVRLTRPPTAVVHSATLLRPEWIEWKVLIESEYPVVLFDDGAYQLRKPAVLHSAS